MIPAITADITARIYAIANIPTSPTLLAWKSIQPGTISNVLNPGVYVKNIDQPNDIVKPITDHLAKSLPNFL
ncbi:MAG: hypothetical protein DRP42_00805 [Tenericutes bacterium]|nr:MAG: hypothetical protein DRP42_00805 [Mycoplasmatota bacterium]